MSKLRSSARTRRASLRKRSAALINEDLQIDLGPDVMAASQVHGCPLDNVYCLQTHPHADHLDLSHLLSRSPSFGAVGAPVLDFYASHETTRRAAETFGRDLADYSLLTTPGCWLGKILVELRGEAPSSISFASTGGPLLACSRRISSTSSASRKAFCASIIPPWNPHAA